MYQSRPNWRLSHNTTKWVTPKGLRESVKSNGIYDETTGKYVKLYTQPSYGFIKCPEDAFSKFGLQFKNIIINSNILHYFWYEIANTSNQQLNFYIRAVNLDTFEYEDHLITNIIYNRISNIRIVGYYCDLQYGCSFIINSETSTYYGCIRFDWGNYVYACRTNSVIITDKDGSSNTINYSALTYGGPFFPDYDNDKLYLQKTWKISNNTITIEMGSVSINGVESTHTISGIGTSFTFVNTPCPLGFKHPYLYIFIPQCPKILRININDWTSNMNDIVSSENTDLLSHTNGEYNLWMHGKSLDGKIMYTDYGNSGRLGAIRFVYFEEQTLTNVIIGYGNEESFRSDYLTYHSKYIMPTNKNGWYAGGVFIRSDDLKIITISEPVTTLPGYASLSAVFRRPLSKVGYYGEDGFWHHESLGRMDKYIDIAAYVAVNNGSSFSIMNGGYYLVKSNLDDDFRSPEVLK